MRRSSEFEITRRDEGSVAVSRSFVLTPGNVGASCIVVGFVNLKQLLLRASDRLSERLVKTVVCRFTEFWHPGLTLGSATLQYHDPQLAQEHLVFLRIKTQSNAKPLSRLRVRH
jgi:hypothetical protein